jgi:hypothetical protein
MGAGPLPVGELLVLLGALALLAGLAADLLWVWRRRARRRAVERDLR